MTSDAHERPFAWGPGIFIGIVLLWGATLGLFELGRMAWAALFPGEAAGS
jgi:hypothetical protein